MTRGVVDDGGRVFRNEPGADPRAVNLTLTIIALALRVAQNIRV